MDAGTTAADVRAYREAGADAVVVHFGGDEGTESRMTGLAAEVG